MSVYGTILDQVRDSLDALTLSPTPTVVRRKRFHTLETDTPPLLVVFPLEEDELSGEDQFESVVDMLYPVGVGIVLDGQTFGNVTEVDTMLTMRETIRRTLRSVRAIAVSSSPCINVTCDLRPPFDRSAFAANHDTSAMIFNYTVQEPRNT